MKFTKVTLLILIILLSVISCKKTENQTTENSESVINRIDGRVKDINGRIPERKEIDKDYYFIFYGAEWCPFCKKRQPIISTFFTMNTSSALVILKSSSPVHKEINQMKI